MLKSIKNYLKIIFFLFCFLIISESNVHADKEITDLIDYIEVTSNISEITSTIIPEQSAIEVQNKKIRIVESSIIESIPEGAGSYVIGDKRIISEDDYYWLCKIVQCEAGGEDEIGKILVVNVIFNRFDQWNYKTIKDVIFAKGQFSPVGSGIIYKKEASKQTIEAVNKALNGVDYSKGALYFMCRKLSDPKNVKWFDSDLTWLFKHGCHEFFK